MSMTEEAPDPLWLRLAGRLLAAAIVLAAAWAVYLVNVDTFSYPRTDDAVVRANVIGIAPEVGGRLIALHVQDNQEVAAGALLFEIDPAPYEAERAVAEAELALARSTSGGQENAIAAARADIVRLEAELAAATETVNRYRPLVQKGAVAQLALDDAIGRMRSLQASVQRGRHQRDEAINRLALQGGVDARVKAAEARLQRAELNLGYTKVHAPFRARVANLNLAVGAYAHPGQALFSLIDLDHWWVVANFQESYIDRIRPGDRAGVRLVTYPDTVFEGTVQDVGWGIAVGGGAPGAPPQVPAITNWVRIANRLPVRIALPPPPPGQPYRMGLTATVTVHRAD